MINKALLCLFVIPAASLLAASPGDPPKKITTEEFEAKLHYQHGTITLKDGLATLNVSPEFRYLDPKEANLILVNAWGNPPGTETLGMLFPTGVSPLTKEGWGVVITYEEDGYVKDDDAEKINYDDLLKKMKKGEKEDNAQRVKEGYAPIALVGWATPPRYDRATHKLYWAKELQVRDVTPHTLNYNIRVLGRKGVLVLNAVAGMDQLQDIEKDMTQVITLVDFNEGHRYADYKPGADKIAAYGIAGLVAGGLAAKAGFFKLLWVGILAFKKFIIIAVVAIGAFLSKLFKRGDKAST